MRGQFAAPFCRGTRFSLALAVWAVPSVGRAADTVAPGGQVTRPSTLYLYLALACFGFAAYLLVRRTGALRGAHRRRSQAMLRIRPADPMARAGAFFTRWFPRNPAPERVHHWEERTRTAEQRAEQALAVLRAEFTPRLEKIMRDRVVISLIEQRALLLGAQQANAEQVLALEQRLILIQKQVLQQSQEYEQRIVQLEKELHDKGAVTRELLRFRVLLARQALEGVRPGTEPARTMGR
jgi:hypothetical protein